MDLDKFKKTKTRKPVSLLSVKDFEILSYIKQHLGGGVDELSIKTRMNYARAIAEVGKLNKYGFIEVGTKLNKTALPTYQLKLTKKGRLIFRLFVDLFADIMNDEIESNIINQSQGTSSTFLSREARIITEQDPDNIQNKEEKDEHN